MNTKEIIYAGQIINASSIISLLDGSSMFCVSNPYFNVPGIYPSDKKTFLVPDKRKITSNGVTLYGVDLYVKTQTGAPYTKSFTIAWALSRGVKKSYYVMKPFDMKKLTDNHRQKVMVSPRGVVGNDDANLVLLDYQLCVIMEILTLAVINDIDLGTYAGIIDNRAFIRKFYSDITARIKSFGVDDSFKFIANDAFIDSFADSFTKPPYYMKQQKKYIPIKELGNSAAKARIISPFAAFYSAYSNEGLIDRYKRFSSIIMANSTCIPSFRNTDYERKHDGEFSGEHISSIDTRLTFMIKLNESDSGFNARMPNFLFTQKVVGKARYEQLDSVNIHQMWGLNEARGVQQEGVMMITPSLAFKYYAAGNPTIEWRVEKVAVKATVRKGAIMSAEGDEFGFSDDDTPETHSTSHSREADIDDDMSEII